MTERFDVVVVGSGAGGSPVAFELAKAGARVLVLEKGPRLEKRDFLHDEIAMCRRDIFTPYTDDDPHTIRRDPSARAAATPEGWISRCVGGGTVHMSGFFFRFHPKDFALQRHFGPIAHTTAIDWPIGWEELEPHYLRAERGLGVSGDASRGPPGWPSRPAFLHPPVLTHPLADAIDRAAEKLGIHSTPVPRAIITTPAPDRSPCVYCALCGSYGCEVDAKSSTLVSTLRDAERTGRCEVRPNAMATEIVMMRNGRAKGVAYVDAAGVTHAVDASVVVVACGAIESARLLLLSRCSRHPMGLGNNGGQVGRNLCFSTLGRVAGTLGFDGRDATERAMLENPAPFIGRAFFDWHELPRAGDVFGRGGMFHVLFEHPNPIHRAERLVRDTRGLVFGSRLVERLRERFLEGRTLEVECFGEWLPTEGCRVALDDQVTDRFGLPCAQISILERHPSDLAASRVLVSRATEVLAALGCTDVRTEVVGGETLVLQHGTCRMGTDPATSVTTRSGALHEVDNVYVTDGGSMPSGGSVPSTLTISANSHRIADRIRDDWR